ncbi:MAG: hypothetical protein ISR72_12760 [Methylobacter sp.]|nr:hypothetical protein [Methylobacter sp.]
MNFTLSRFISGENAIDMLQRIFILPARMGYVLPVLKLPPDKGLAQY